MAKKSRASGKAEFLESETEDTTQSVPEFNIPNPGGGTIDFVHLMNVMGILMVIAAVLFLLNEAVFHLL